LISALDSSLDTAEALTQLPKRSPLRTSGSLASRLDRRLTAYGPIIHSFFAGRGNWEGGSAISHRPRVDKLQMIASCTSMAMFCVAEAARSTYIDLRCGCGVDVNLDQQSWRGSGR
jgi:hypothetical protein